MISYSPNDFPFGKTVASTGLIRPSPFLPNPAPIIYPILAINFEPIP